MTKILAIITVYMFGIPLMPVTKGAPIAIKCKFKEGDCSQGGKIERQRKPKYQGSPGQVCINT